MGLWPQNVYNLSYKHGASEVLNTLTSTILMPNITIVIAVIFVITLAVLVLIGGYTPTSIEIGSDTCVTSYCLVGQKVNMNINLNGVKTNSLKVSSDAMTKDVEKDMPEIGNNPIEFSLSTQNIEGRHFIRIEAEPESDTVWSIRKFLLGWLLGDKVVHEEYFDVRYPKIELEYTESSSSSLVKISDAHLKNKDDKQFTCKIAIETSPDISLVHSGFNKINEGEDFKLYESSLENIQSGFGSKCCTNIEFNAGTQAATAQIEIKPVCSIDGNYVSIENQRKLLSWQHIGSPLPTF